MEVRQLATPTFIPLDALECQAITQEFAAYRRNTQISFDFPFRIETKIPLQLNSSSMAVSKASLQFPPVPITIRPRVHGYFAPTWLHIACYTLNRSINRT